MWFPEKVNLSFHEPSLQRGAVRGFLLLLTALSMAACSFQRTVSVRHSIPGTGAYWIEEVPVYKRPREPRAPKSSKLMAPRHDEGEWHGDTMTGSPSMIIRLSEQKIYFYKGGQLAGVSPISSGREGMATRSGSFSVIEKDKDHASSLFGDYVSRDGTVLKREIDVRKDPRPPGAMFDAARMPYFMRITGAIGMHEGYLPGYPASHGCIRLPQRMAEIFFHHSSVGTPVKIVP